MSTDIVVATTMCYSCSYNQIEPVGSRQWEQKMTSVTIFGSGNMGTAIAGVLSAGGADVEHIGSADTGATIAGDVVILAVPYPALEGIVASYGPQFAGKI